MTIAGLLLRVRRLFARHPPPIAKADAKIRCERFGSDYGGWVTATDGLDAGSVVYSAGLGEDASFDIALINRFGLTIHAFDPTPKSIAWAKQQHFPPNFHLREYGLAGFDGEAVFYPPENPDYVSCTMEPLAGAENRAMRVPMRRLASAAEEIGTSEIAILKMDIEGAEYAVIDDLLRTACRPGQILLEFHHGHYGLTEEMTKRSIDLLRDAGYRLFFVSPSQHEFSLVYDPEARL